MSYLRYIFGPVYFIYKLWIGLMFWLTLLLMYPVFLILLSRKKWFPIAFKVKVGWSKVFQLLLFCPVAITYRAKFPPPPYVIVSNHSSYLDTVFMYSVVPHYFLFIGKGELLKWPLFNLFFKKQDIPIHRNSPRKAYEAMQQAYEAIDNGSCIALYPEGTIPDDAPRMKHFKNGAFKMAIDKQIPVVPITFLQNYKILLDPAKFFEYSLPAQVVTIVHPSISTAGMKEEDVVNLRQQVFDAIDESLPPQFRSEKK